jgi:hypothetical protein
VARRKRKSPKTRLTTNERRKGVSARTVYIGLRHYKDFVLRNCKGFNLRAYDFTPEEVHGIILTALQQAAQRAQLLAKGQEVVDGTGDQSQR